ncbi:hypothetical protein L2E82_24575 [Cichorium intybus]|uniref:Uncharacterized protein n=1 Tax=Cichorium intybus TaxID=13427 RepID=A0ACB9E1E2_CICIN|nr:hypothetical protein L2E82_24575 [Cichorium intybus]
MLLSFSTSKDGMKFTNEPLSQNMVPKGWDKLSLSIISVETQETLDKTGRALGSDRSGILGEVTENLSNHLNSETSISIAKINDVLALTIQFHA